MLQESFLLYLRNAHRNDNTKQTIQNTAVKTRNTGNVNKSSNPATNPGVCSASEASGHQKKTEKNTPHASKERIFSNPFRVSTMQEVATNPRPMQANRVAVA
jgi:hypothetical protein